MRVIAGSAGGIPLKVPKAVARPTTDRVREALFAILGPRTVGAAVLDLFAGSGALGIEALSRGARSAVFVERDPRAARIIEENLGKTRLADRARVVVTDAFAYLRRIASATGEASGAPGSGAFDLVFADPPYRRTRGDADFAGALLRDPHLPRLVSGDGVFVLESSADAAHGDGRSWSVADRRVYGSTALHLLVPAAALPERDPRSGRRETPLPPDP